MDYHCHGVIILTWERALEVGFQSTHAQAIARLIDTYSDEGQRVATAIIRALEGILDPGTVDFEDFCRALIDSWEEFAVEANVPLVGEAEVEPELGDEPNLEFEFEEPESEDEPEDEAEIEHEPEVGQEIEVEAQGEIRHEAEMESEPESTITSDDEAPPAKVPRVHGGWISEDDD
ncbi:protein TsetseEP-like [Abeliophyllum distichum]|uniref:Protein TsetseEP-like n=1 Tax=Abeliophyllum distichum TaxID=126358 RepID=A0ABD1PCV0_9LAMI